MPPSRPAEGAAAWRARAAGGYEGALAGPGGSPIAWQLPRIQLSEGLVASSREAAKERLDLKTLGESTTPCPCSR